MPSTSRASSSSTPWTRYPRTEPSPTPTATGGTASWTNVNRYLAAPSRAGAGHPLLGPGPALDPVSDEEELRRIVPVIRKILESRPGAVVSVDTYRARTAEVALDAGASLVNDVTALRGDARMAALVAGAGCPVVLMHMLGEPKTMQREPRYKDVTREVRGFLEERVGHASAAGVRQENVILDPGIGFGKTVEHNLTLLARLDEIVALGSPVLLGASRKRFLGSITGAGEAKDRLFGTVATTVLGYERGATLFRVHDVRANREALAVAAAVRLAPGGDRHR